MDKKLFIAANWKLNGNCSSLQALTGEINSNLLKLPSVLDKMDLVLCPPAAYLQYITAEVQETGIAVGSQDVSKYDQGAYTGEVSASMCADVGSQYTILGHSERRALFNESTSDISLKLKQAKAQGLKPIICVGETDLERNEGLTNDIVHKQLVGLIEACGIESFREGLIAYEPVWAIGTGITPTPEEVQVVHAYIKELIGEYSVEIANGVRVIYGGSVKASNASSLFAMPDVDGALIGGAALDAGQLDAIINSLITG